MRADEPRLPCGSQSRIRGQQHLTPDQHVAFTRRFGEVDRNDWLLPPAGTPTRVFIDEAFAVAKLAPPQPVVEASTTRVAHLLIRANPGWAGVVPMDTGHDIEAMGGVCALPFPLPLKMPVIGLMYATRHKDTPVIRLLRTCVRAVLNRPGGSGRAS